MGEPINETGLSGKGLTIRGKHVVMLDSETNSSTAHRLMAEAMMLRPYVVFVRDSESYKDWSKKYPVTVSLYNMF